MVRGQVLAWSRKARDHYVPLVNVDTLAPAVFPTRPPADFKKQLAESGLRDPFCQRRHIGACHCVCLRPNGCCASCRWSTCVGLLTMCCCCFGCRGTDVLCNGTGKQSIWRPENIEAPDFVEKVCCKQRRARKQLSVLPRPHHVHISSRPNLIASRVLFGAGLHNAR